MKYGDGQITILIAVGNNIIAEGLHRILIDDSSYQVIKRGDSKLGIPADLVLFDSNQKVQDLTANYPNSKLILLDTGLKDRDITYLLLCHQISGIIPPDASIELFHKALKVVRNGESWIDQEQLKSLLRSGASISDSGDLTRLSEKDKMIVQLVTKGYKNKEIGTRLCLSQHTIKAHVSRIYKSLNVNNRTQLVGLVMQCDLETVESQGTHSH
jgi:DNA-binding NarL/FixJ family response regulator